MAGLGGDYPAIIIARTCKIRRLLFITSLSGLVLMLAACAGGSNTPPPGIDASAVYAQNCSPCHGADRQGRIGPNLTAASLQSRDRSEQYILNTITNGRNGMPSWKDRLSPAEIEALAKFLRRS